MISFTLLLNQVQDKKIKKVCDMNVDPIKSTLNGYVGGSSVSASSKTHTSNAASSLGNNLSFPPGGISSLHLPMVVVLELIIYLHRNFHLSSRLILCFRYVDYDTLKSHIKIIIQ